MPVFQAWNGRSKRWVKYEFTKRGFRPLDVKQRNPRKPFVGVPIRGKRRK
jgi:hypothetical protein